LEEMRYVAQQRDEFCALNGVALQIRQQFY
jgi:hypothetical protein